MSTQVDMMAALEPLEQALEHRVANGIENHRKGWATLKLQTADGQPLAGDDIGIEVELTRHHFRFGCNSFMLGGYPTDALNARYEEAFVELFNEAIVGLFWGDYEPEEGKLRFAPDSPTRYRRPPIDTVVAWGEKHGLQLKGHNLMWHQIAPTWLPNDREAVERLMYRRIGQLAERYGNRMHRWDVVNEPLCHPLGRALPRDYVYKAFREAQRVLPSWSQLILNETSGDAWMRFKDDETPFYLLAQNLQLRGIRLGGLGLQYHQFMEKRELEANAAKTWLNPHFMLAAMDQYARLGVPLNISEITLSAYSNEEADDELQARMARALYRLWFSHPAVEAIVWWNLGDGYAYGNESRFRGGLLNPDLTPKPAYEALAQLIKQDWHTRERLQVRDSGATFHGFYGDYRVSVHRGGQRSEQTVRFSPHGTGTLTLTL